MKQHEKAMPPQALPRPVEALECSSGANGNAAEADRYRKELVACKATQKETKK